MRKNQLLGTIVVTLLFFYLINPQGLEGATKIGSAVGYTLGAFLWIIILSFLLRLIKTSFFKNYSLLIACLFILLVYAGSFLYIKSFSHSKEKSILSCQDEIERLYGVRYDSVLNLNQYCECAVSKIYEQKNINIDKALKDMQDINSSLFNEVLLPCALEAVVHKKNKLDILGFVNSDTLAVVPTSMGIRAKIVIGTIEYYFILDSGATDMSISEAFYKKILQENIGIVEQKLPDAAYRMANGEIQNCKRTILNQVKIGRFLIPEVTFCITPKESYPLLGRNILDRFTSWSVIDNNKILILNR